MSRAMQEFKVVKKVGRAIKLKCPHKSCENIFTVTESKWRSKKQLTNKLVKTRPCPYCFRASLLPKTRD